MKYLWTGLAIALFLAVNAVVIGVAFQAKDANAAVEANQGGYTLPDGIVQTAVSDIR